MTGDGVTQLESCYIVGTDKISIVFSCDNHCSLKGVEEKLTGCISKCILVSVPL